MRYRAVLLLTVVALLTVLAGAAMAGPPVRHTVGAVIYVTDSAGRTVYQGSRVYTDAAAPTITLDGLGSSCSQGDALSYRWRNAIDGTSLGTSPSVTVTLGPGLSRIELAATCVGGGTDRKTAQFHWNDITPPVITAPADVAAEQASAAGTAVNIGTATATDNVTALPTVTHTPELAVYPLGTTVVTWTATDAAGNSAQATQNVTVVDTTAPSITAPADVTAEQASHDGTRVGIGTASASDICDANPAIVSDAPATFPLGTTVVTWTATDAAGNSAQATQNVTVVDTTAPSITAPADVTAEQTSHAGTRVGIGTASAGDICDANPAIRSDAPATFPLGTTVVTWTATDAAGNSAQATQNVTVVDTTAPSITAPADVTAEQTSHAGTRVGIGTASASDICDANPAISSDAPATFPLGTTVVTWTATDAAGNASTATQAVTVKDTTAPDIILTGIVNTLWPCNHKLVLVATVKATDICDASPVLGITVTSNEGLNGRGDGNSDSDWLIDRSDPNVIRIWLRAERSGGAGGRIYVVRVTATDATGNASSTSYTVTVPADQGKKK